MRRHEKSVTGVTERYSDFNNAICEPAKALRLALRNGFPFRGEPVTPSRWPRKILVTSKIKPLEINTPVVTQRVLPAGPTLRGTLTPGCDAF